MDLRSRVEGWMVVDGFGHIRERDALGLPWPDLATLADEIAEATEVAGRAWIVHPYDDPHPWPARIDATDIEGMAEDAARLALSDYDRAIYESANLGGRTSRRRPTWGDADLDALAAMDGSIREQAEATGRSQATISRMRHALAQRGQTSR